jgi:hypothetical protein
MRVTQAVDIEDLVQEAWPSVLRLMDQFASPRRPPITWAAAVKRNVLRDLNRVEPKLAGVSFRVWQIRRWLDQHPDVAGPELVRDLIVADYASAQTPTVKQVWGSGKVGPNGKNGDRHFMSERLVRLAMTIPNIVPLDVLVERQLI